MITCKHAKHLFDGYLDGELSPSLQGELHAHQLNCPDCQGELAMFEACGDVIRLDRREPGLSASFTDRVILAHRSRQVIRPRRWMRSALLVVSPMAAAASIAAAVLLILPSVKQVPEQMVAAHVEAVPEAVQEALIATADTKRSPEADRELAQTPQMSTVDFVDTLAASVVSKARNTLAGARRGAAQFEGLLRQGWSAQSDRLLAEWQSHQADNGAGEAGQDRAILHLDPSDPTHLNRSWPTEPRTDYQPEAL